MSVKLDYDKIAKKLGAEHKENKPERSLAVQTLAMPADTNPYGDIFGGWLLSQMDIAGAITAGEIANNRVVTIALDKMMFAKPVFVGDVLKCYTTIERIGNTSITILVEAYATRVSDSSSFEKSNGPINLIGGAGGSGDDARGGSVSIIGSSITAGVIYRSTEERVAGQTEKVTEGRFTYVSIDRDRNPRPIKS